MPLRPMAAASRVRYAWRSRALERGANAGWGAPLLRLRVVVVSRPPMPLLLVAMAVARRLMTVAVVAMAVWWR